MTQAGLQSNLLQESYIFKYIELLGFFVDDLWKGCLGLLV